MELNTVQESVAACEVVYDSFVEQPIECDILLPDYCPDILKILTCSATPVFTLVQANGAQLAVDGHAMLSITYLSDAGSVRCSEHKVPFSRTIELKSAPESPVISYHAAVDYMNCRAVSPRRADVRGALTVQLKVLSQKKESVVTDAQGEGIQLLRQTAPVTQVVGCASRQYTLREELQIEDSEPGVRHIVRCSCRAQVTDYKAIANKVIAKGELKVSFLYSGYENERDLHIARFTLPISQIVDVDGVDENCRCDVHMHVVSCELIPRSDELGEGRTVSLEAVFCAVVKAYRQMDTAWVSDCYCTQYESSFTTRAVSSLSLLDILNTTLDKSESLKLPQQVTDVTDVWCRAGFTEAKSEEEGLILYGKLTVCMLAVDTDANPLYCEQALEIRHVCAKYEAEQLITDIQMEAGDCAFVRSGEDSLEIKTQVYLAGSICGMRRRQAVDTIELDESKGRKPQSQAAITIYFADEGEAMWEIAKRYNTSMAAVMEENGLEGANVPQRSMLLIPIVP